METSISRITQIWDKALIEIEKKLNDKNMFDSFFSESYIYEINESTITIVASSSLAKTLLESRYIDLITETLVDITETNFAVKFIEKKDAINKTTEVPAAVKKQTYFENSKINPKLTFSNFVIGDFNREANQACVLVASDPGKTFLNPLFIYSNSGLGKTHLLHAVANHVIKEVNPKAKILYMTATDFVEEYIKFVRGDKESESMKDYISSADVLLFDDVQFLAEKVKTQEMFFNIYQRLINDGKQIILTSDRQPSELKGLENRLVTRFSQGLTVKIDSPDTQTCLQILKNKITANNLNIEDFDQGVLDFFSDKFNNNVRELEGALNRLIFYAVNFKHSNKITMELAMEAAGSLIAGKTLATQLSEQKVINVVADYYNLTPSQLTGKIRTGQIALARHIAMYLIRNTMDVPLKKIGDMFGGKDHTTVMSAITKVDKELINNEQLKLAVEELKKQLKA